MTGYHLGLTDILLLRAVDAGEITVRESRGYHEGKPEGWVGFDYRGRLAETDSEARLRGLERGGYIDCDDDGPVRLTSSGRDAVR